MNEVNGYYSLAIHPGQLNTWYTPLERRRSPIAGMFDPEELAAGRALIPENLRDNYHHGKVSDIAKKKISRAVSYITSVVPKKRYYHPGTGKSGEFVLNFITLTLSSEQIHSDNEIKSYLLEPFLNTCRQKWQVVSYIWRAEKQENGNLHFHIIADRFIPWNELRNMWNRHQERLGYITRYRLNQKLWHREGFKYRPNLEKSWPRHKQYKAYQDGINHDWANPNSTDVHGLHKLHSISAYLIKYITKQEQAENIEGRLWGCSANLVKLRGGESFAEGSLADEIESLEKETGSRRYHSDYFSCLYYDPKILYSGRYPLLCALLEKFITARFSEYRPPTLFDP